MLTFALGVSSRSAASNSAIVRRWVATVASIAVWLLYGGGHSSSQPQLCSNGSAIISKLRGYLLTADTIPIVMSDRLDDDIRANLDDGNWPGLLCFLSVLAVSLDDG